jgi:hypothetical protein
MNLASGAPRQPLRLTPERWAQLDFGRQIRLIAGELQRAGRLTAAADRGRRRSSLERVYTLLDLTIACSTQQARRRELLTWRELLGMSYLDSASTPAADRALLRALLRLDAQPAQRAPRTAR